MSRYLLHYRFKQRLLHKSREHPDCRVYIVNESYTSKTCDRCGHIHSELGGGGVLKCSSVQVAHGRLTETSMVQETFSFASLVNI